MVSDILSAFAAALLIWLAYRDWYAYQFTSVIGAAIGALLIISLIAVYVVDREPAFVDTPAPSATVR